jgi:hypothetical protein
MELKAFFILIEWAKATFWLLAYFSHCWCLSEAAPIILISLVETRGNGNKGLFYFLYSPS